MSLKIGAKIANQFRVESILGQGGFGSAYLVHDLNLGVSRVIKELQARYLLDDSAQARFVNEARTMASLNHPHIVTVHQLLMPPIVRDCYIVMEYMAGGSLDHLLDKEGKLSVNQSVEIIMDVCKGLEPAHRRDIVHRDIKPHNILLSEDEVIVKVGDWGIAHIPDASFTIGGQPGTLPYMSPEQAHSHLFIESGKDKRKIDSRSDLYSVGTVLFQMVTGHFYLDFKQISHEASEAFRRQHRLLPNEEVGGQHLEQAKMTATLQAIIDHPAQRPTTYNSSISPAVESVILKALAKDPHDRYQTAKEMADALQQALKEPKRVFISPKTPDPPVPQKNDPVYRDKNAVEDPQINNLIQEAKDQVEKMQYETALTLLKEAKAKVPHDPRVYIEMASVYNFLRRHEDARQLLEEGIKMNPHHAVLVRDLGLTYHKLGRIQKAIEALEHSLQLDGKQPRTYALLKKIRGESR